MSQSSELAQTPAVLTDQQTMVCDKIEEWYRTFLIQMRAVAATVSPVPLPSRYQDRSLDTWHNKFTKWLRNGLSVDIATSISPPTKDGKMALRTKHRGNSKKEKITIVTVINKTMWELFWRADLNQGRIARDPIFVITEQDREYLTLLACALDLGEIDHLGKMIWTAFDLSPQIWECAPIYQACCAKNTALAETIGLESLDCVSNLDLDWCKTLARACARVEQDGLVNWLLQHRDLTDGQRDQLRSVSTVSSALQGSTDPILLLALMNALRNRS